ncbi:unnamed protein product [Caenorhabditis angaria]|uniref:Uncharacterized protein n=1 Tax=Caenorhabditis angaria TaxID=860376 RepID=A0A9P1IDP3_9PELO|nr:unnamed protein product [Caenorhabditis angaria]
MSRKSESSTISTISGNFVSYDMELPGAHYNRYKERMICGKSGVVIVVSAIILIAFFILLGLLAIVMFPILRQKQ